MLQLLQDLAFIATVTTCFVVFLRGLRAWLERHDGEHTTGHGA